MNVCVYVICNNVGGTVQVPLYLDSTCKKV